MKKHVIVTIGVLLVFSVLLAGLFIWRSRMDAGDSANPPVQEGNVNDTLSDGKQDGSDSETMWGTEHTQNIQEISGTENTLEKEETDMPITMIFAGDVLFRSYFREHYPSEGIGCAISNDLLDSFVNADLAMVNQEFPFSTRGVPMEGKQYAFRIDPSYVTALNDLGIDIVTLANKRYLYHTG